MLCKNLTYSHTQKLGCNHPKMLTSWLYQRVMHPKDADGMANSVDPDQTAPLGSGSGSDLGLHCLPRPKTKYYYGNFINFML